MTRPIYLDVVEQRTAGTVQPSARSNPPLFFSSRPPEKRALKIELLSMRALNGYNEK